MYGPPGTGKSSLSFAIAGYFRLKIYIVSLNSPAMNEESLGTLFADLPKKCLVLLEDIDTAGLTHTRDEKPREEVKPVESGTTVVTTNDTNNNTGRISLSALLNILDGVASQEGRVLVMTTNHVDKLDDALIRPGRVDMKIKFDLANTDMIITIFRAIFATIEGDIPRTAKSNGVVIRSPKSDSAESKTGDARSVEDAEKEAEAARVAEEKRLAEEARISQLGQQFAELIPTMTFSPAEIQGYLLKNKRDPEVAIKNAEAWVKNTLATKEKEEQEEREKETKEEAERQKAEKEKTQREEAEKEKAGKESAGEAVNGEEEKGKLEGKKA